MLRSDNWPGPVTHHEVGLVRPAPLVVLHLPKTKISMEFPAVEQKVNRSWKRNCDGDGNGSESISLNHMKKNLPWQNGLFEERVGTTVYVTNLDQGVTNEDMRELFGEIGEMKRYAIHYDQNGRPNEVVYMGGSDAFQAMRDITVSCWMEGQ
ncbi:hypothetical protein Bca52824_035073 [Brassica carinata]|uniref:RRM domain-containing protein n=1 Tax=Brassica carinata TaxID=52824 RepID=A0A8X7S2Y7_BRACI|nr:hypothetical protein Bca52824_035073 [Brassica carinata]